MERDWRPVLCLCLCLCMCMFSRVHDTVQAGRSMHLTSPSSSPKSIRHYSDSCVHCDEHRLPHRLPHQPAYHTLHTTHSIQTPQTPHPPKHSPCRSFHLTINVTLVLHDSPPITPATYSCRHHNKQSRLVLSSFIIVESPPSSLLISQSPPLLRPVDICSKDTKRGRKISRVECLPPPS